ncbi:rhodanese-like domain-containing protein [Avibacterium paragallinarum]|uniref:Thiosulfate sulfur transferase n=1 Tax=Avibacterium paragallinarum TaxID=728 RepID=A0A377I8F9_AVIPA|nr:rhodanese-like domain-containing protein [Avibacterium paragallinarum]CDF98706.1 Putative SseA protein [Avibacterium paragallinarum JF4211]STO71658.1 thiosulfate sulfur transferase [Avibacterium paragallinarum]
MKMKPILLAVAVSLALSACNDRKVTLMETRELLNHLDDPNFVIIDTRQDSLYNGFKEKNATRGGYIKGAIQFSCDWLEHIQPEKFDSFAAGKGITKEKHLVFYDSNPENLDCVTAEFAARGYKVSRFNDFLSYANAGYPFESFANFQYSVSPQWVNAALKGEKPETLNNDKVMLFEVSWGDLEHAKAYMQHIVGAYHFNTDWVENDPVWNLSDPKVIEKNLLANGITKDKTVILYSDNQLAAYRIFWALKWAGVEDVRVLNGNLATWLDAGLPTETKINLPQPEKDFGTTIPANPQIDIATPQQAMNAQKAGLKLISNRAWDEYTGKVSGYDYIPGKGEPQGAIWGFAGTDSSNMADYYDPDNTLRNPNEIFALWQTQGIHKGDKLAFYCGTGWRAGVPWFLTQLAGWKDTVIYDGGWNAWQMDSQYPVQKGAPNPQSKPDSKNDFGKVMKKGNSCKS